MRCPYCVSEIDDQALACPCCAHDLYLFKSLLEKIGQLEQTIALQDNTAVASAEAHIAVLEQELAAIKAERAESIPVEGQALPSASTAAPSGYVATLARTLIPALLLLVAAHWVMLFLYDVKPLYLRLATILIPVPFGYLLALHFPQKFRESALGAAALAFAGVFSMLLVTALIDKAPVC